MHRSLIKSDVSFDNSGTTTSSQGDRRDHPEEHSCTLKKGIYSLQLGLALGLLEDGLHLGRLHDVTLDLELAAHEQTLGVGLASHELLEVLVGEGESDYPSKISSASGLFGNMRLTISLAASRGSALAHLTLVLQVEVPALLLALGVLQVEGDDGLGRVDGVLALALVGLEGLVDGVERGGGGEGVCERELSASWFGIGDLRYAPGGGS